MSVPKAVPRVLLAGLGFLVLTLFAQSAKADAVYLDFTCSGPACNGSVNASGGNFSTMGITLFEGSGFYTGSYTIASAPFTLVFNTATPGTITLEGTGAELGEDFIGTIANFSASSTGFNQTDLTLVVNWTTLPSDVLTYFAPYAGGGSIGSVIDLSSSGTVTSSDFTVTPAPEPATLLLLAGGLLALGFMARIRAHSIA